MVEAIFIFFLIGSDINSDWPEEREAVTQGGGGALLTWLDFARGEERLAGHDAGHALTGGAGEGGQADRHPRHTRQRHRHQPAGGPALAHQTWHKEGLLSKIVSYQETHLHWLYHWHLNWCRHKLSQNYSIHSDLQTSLRILQHCTYTVNTVHTRILPAQQGVGLEDGASVDVVPGGLGLLQGPDL